MSKGNVATRDGASKSAASTETSAPLAGEARKEPAPSTEPERDAELPAVGLHDIARHFEAVGTPEARRVARILCGTATAYLFARAPRPGRERARGLKLLEKADAVFHPATGLRARNRPSVAMKTHEAVREADMWIRAWLMLTAENTKDSPLRANLSMWTKPPEGPAISETEALSRVFHAVADLGVDVVRAFDLGTDGLRDQLVDHLQFMAKNAVTGRLTTKDAPRIIEGALVLGGMPKKEARDATRILRNC